MITTYTKQLSFFEIKPKMRLRYKQILDRLDKPKTAKELAVELFIDKIIPTTERNFTAPRLTELERMGYVRVIEKKRCQYTGKTVSIFERIDNND